MLRSDADEHRLAEQLAPSEGDSRFRSDPALVVKLSQGLLLKARMKLDLVDCWRDRRAVFQDDSRLALIGHSAVLFLLRELVVGGGRRPGA